MENEKLESEEKSITETEIAEAESLDEANWREEMLASGVTDEQLKLFEKLVKKTSFYARPVQRDTSMDAKKELRGEIIISDEDEELSTTSALKQDLLEINASAREGRVLGGRIIGCRTAGDSNVSTVLAVVEFGSGQVQVLIPSYLLFNYDVKLIRLNEDMKKIEARIIKMIGTEIKFIVKHYDQKSNTAYADRLKALEQDAYNNYIRRLNKTGKPRVQVGSIVKGQITAVHGKYITVNALGSETNIYQDQKHGSEVSWYHIEDLRNVFRVNQAIYCKVLSVDVSNVKKYDEEYTLVAAELSVKQCENDPQVEYYDDYKIGQYCECTVSAVNELGAGVYGILTNGVSKIDCLISFPRYGSLPSVGERRVVKITNKADKTESGSMYEKDGRLVRRIFGIFADT